jgi:hypothetical protein
VSQISVGQTSSNQLEVFGIGGNGAVFVMQEGSTYSSWTRNSWVNLNGFATSLDVLSDPFGSGSVLYAVGTDGQVHSFLPGTSGVTW